MRYSVSGGGSGGHVYPALAVARALRDERRDVELDYIGGVRGFERRLVASHELGTELTYHELVVRSLRSAGLSVHTLLDPARLAASVPQAWWLLGRLKPAALFTTGGYLAVPLVLAARARGIPSARSAAVGPVHRELNGSEPWRKSSSGDRPKTSVDPCSMPNCSGATLPMSVHGAAAPVVVADATNLPDLISSP